MAARFVHPLLLAAAALAAWLLAGAARRALPADLTWVADGAAATAGICAAAGGALLAVRLLDRLVWHGVVQRQRGHPPPRL